MAEELTMEMNFDRPIMTELPPMDMPMEEPKGLMARRGEEL